MKQRAVGVWNFAGKTPVLLATLVAAMLAAVPAAAEPIQVLSGFAINYWDADVGGFGLIAANSQFASESRGTPLGGFQGGSVVNLSSGVAASNANHVPLSQTFEGTLYRDVWLSGGLSLVVEPFVAPHSSTNDFVTFTRPFTMTGQINGFANPDLTGPLFSTAVVGSGTTTVTFHSLPDDTFFLQHAGGQSFSFSAQPAATPEPGSVLLVATGVAGVFMRRLRRRC